MVQPLRDKRDAPGNHPLPAYHLPDEIALIPVTAATPGGVVTQRRVVVPQRGMLAFYDKKAAPKRRSELSYSRAAVLQLSSDTAPTLTAETATAHGVVPRGLKPPDPDADADGEAAEVRAQGCGALPSPKP